MNLKLLTPVRLLSGFLLILVLRLLIGTGYRTAISAGIGGADFGVIYDAASRLDRGESLYLSEDEAQKRGQLLFQFTCSPLIPLVTEGLSMHLSKPDARNVWTGASIAALALSCALFAWGVRLQLLDDANLVILLLLTAFRFLPSVTELALGNTHTLLLLCASALFVCNRYKKWFLFAILVAVGTLIKTWFIGALFFLLAVRQWRAAVAGGVAFLAGITILFSVIGWKEFVPFLNVTRAYASDAVLVSHSVAGIGRLLFQENPFMTPWYVSRIAFFAFTALGYGVLVAGLFWLFLRGPSVREKERPLLLALTFGALLLGLHTSHISYFVLGLPLIWTLLLGSVLSEYSVAFGLVAFGGYLVLSVALPCMTPIPLAYQTGVKSILVTMVFVPTFVLWCLGVVLACKLTAGGDSNGRSNQLKAFGKRFAPGAYGMLKRLRILWRFRIGHGGAEFRAKRALVRHYGQQVLSGPFKGMRYGNDAACSAYVAKLVGSYEEELHGMVEQIIERRYSRVVDIGAAEGYYVVGLALRMPEAEIHSFDADPDAQDFCRALAKLNAVSDRVTVGGFCHHATLESLCSDDTMIICDCEGFEKVLLDPKLVPSLSRTDVLVELHEFIEPGLTEQVLACFRDSHSIQLINTRARNPGDYPLLEPVPPNDRYWAVREGRPAGMQWAFLTSKKWDAGKEKREHRTDKSLSSQRQ